MDKNPSIDSGDYCPVWQKMVPKSSINLGTQPLSNLAQGDLVQNSKFEIIKKDYLKFRSKMLKFLTQLYYLEQVG